MSTTAPSTPVRKVGVNRSFTVPAKSAAVTSRAQPTAEIGAADGIETLYVHSNAKIVKFNSGSSSRPGSSSSGAVGLQHGGGALPWATTTEQTLAVGPLEIYRVPGSVSFLHSGSLLHAILPRSNCWCVDGLSKFAMRVLTDTYYRIELPGESQEDQEKVEAFKETLKKVLFYERTPCPFARTFTVDLPEEKPVRRKRRSTHGPAKKWKLDRAYSWKPEDGREPPQQSTSEEDSGSMTDEDEEDDVRAANSIAEDVSEASLADGVEDLAIQVPKFRVPPRPTVRDRVRGLSMRSVTAPVRSSTQTSPSRLKTSFPADAVTMNDSQESSQRRTYQQMPTDMPPSPPDSSAGFEYAEVPGVAMQPSPVVEDSSASTKVLKQPEETWVCTPLEQVPEVDSNTDIDIERQPENTLVSPSPAVLDPTPEIGADQVDGDADTTHILTPATVPDDVVVEQQVREHNEANEVIGNEVEPAALPGAVVATSLLSEHVLEPISVLHAADDALASQHQPAERASAEVVSAPHTPVDQLVKEEEVEPRLVSELRTPVAAMTLPEARIEQEPKDAASAVTETTPDPFAQIQARIQARRSIGGTTTSFVPPNRSPTRQHSFSTASSTGSSLSRRPSAQPHQQNQHLATALVRKACAAFLGPPAHLVALMLKIAARFAKGMFPKSLMFESPRGSVRRIPGSFDLDGSDVEISDDDIEDMDELEDDFGVPIGGPMRAAAGLRERRGRELQL